MAIDTENKRRSVQAYLMGAVRPVPDGTIDASDRACSAWFYSGLAYALPVAPGIAAYFHKLFNLHYKIPRFS